MESKQQLTNSNTTGKAAVTQPTSDMLQSIRPVTENFGRVKWLVRSHAIAGAVTQVLQSPDDFLTDELSLVKSTSRTTIARIQIPVTGSEVCILRRSNYDALRTVLREVFRTAGPLRAFANALALERAGVSTPKVLAAGVERFLRIPRAGYLLVQAIDVKQTLAECFRQPGRPDGNSLNQVAEAVARMHQSGFAHGDLTINNVLLDETGTPWFIDLDRVQQRNRPLSWSQSVEDSYRLAKHVGEFRPAARRAACRLLKHYCACRGWAGRERDFVEALYNRLQRKLAARLGSTPS